MRSHRVMSFDGGPAGVTFLHCLARIERAAPGFLVKTEVFAGASLGAWIALYLGRNIAAVDRGEITAVRLIEDCLAFAGRAARALRPEEPVEAWIAFLLGQGPLSDTSRVEQVMREEQVYGADTTLGDLASGRRVVIQAARMSAPWAPHVYDSACPEDAEVPLWQVALRSGALPLVVGPRDGEVDGALFTNNPAMTALARVIHGGGRAAPVPMEDVRLLTLGQDDGSSNLSDRVLPGDPPAAAPPSPDEIEEIRRELEGLQARLPVDGKRVATLLANIRSREVVTLPEEVVTMLQGIAPVLEERVAWALQQLDPGASPEVTAEAGVVPWRSWGWPQWLLDPKNPLFLLQVLLNSEGRGPAGQCAELLRDRAFRLAPSGLLSTNVAVLLILLQLDELVLAFGVLTAGQWAVMRPRWLERLYGFRPSFQETLDWVETRWMPA